jgi:hypothetical protein
VGNEGEFSTFIDQLNLNPPFIVKPNWINDELAHYTDPLVLEWLLRKLLKIGEIVVVEAYSARNQLAEDEPGEEKIDKYRRTDKEYLKRLGIERIFEDLGVKYINIDEEILSDDIADPRTVKTITETAFGPVENGELYTFVPKALYDLRGGTFISLAKFKLTFSMATKNLFGLIPDLAQPGGRGFYHGKKDIKLPRNIIDIYKIYCSVFNVVGIVEGIRSMTSAIDKGPHHSMFGYDYDVRENLGLVYFGTDPLWLDAFIGSQCGIEPRFFKTSVLPQSHLSLGYREHPWPAELDKIAKTSGNPL